MGNVPPIQEIYPEKSKHDSSGVTSNPVRKLVTLYSDDSVNTNNTKDKEKNFDGNVKKTSKLRRKKKRTVLLHSNEVSIVEF